MPPPHHLRHPAQHPPHRHTTRVPSPTPQHTLLARHALPARHTRPLHMHRTLPTSSPPYSTSIYAPRPDLLPHIVIPSSVPLCHPSAQRPTPLPHALTPSSAPRSYLSILLPTPPLRTLRALFRGKGCTPPPKASSNPPVEIFCPKRRRRLILNTLPRRHRVDNSVSSSVHSEEKA